MTNVEVNMRAGTVAKIALITALVQMGITIVLVSPMIIIWAGAFAAAMKP